jgi:hypothetical protein
MSTLEIRDAGRSLVAVNTYAEFQKREGIPVIRGFAIEDVGAVELGDWARVGGRGAYIDLEGTGGTNGAYVCEIAPGTSLEPERHLYEGMGRIFDRTAEHLGTSDLGIIRVRQRLIRAAKALAEERLVPASALDPSLYRVRGAATLLPAGGKWLEDTADLRKVVEGVNPAGV